MATKGDALRCSAAPDNSPPLATQPLAAQASLERDDEEALEVEVLAQMKCDHPLIVKVLPLRWHQPLLCALPPPAAMRAATTRCYARCHHPLLCALPPPGAMRAAATRCYAR